MKLHAFDTLSSPPCDLYNPLDFQAVTSDRPNPDADSFDESSSEEELLDEDEDANHRPVKRLKSGSNRGGGETSRDSIGLKDNPESLHRSNHDGTDGAGNRARGEQRAGVLGTMGRNGVGETGSRRREEKRGAEIS